jgi:hypothetical protein
MIPDSYLEEEKVCRYFLMLVVTFVLSYCKNTSKYLKMLQAFDISGHLGIYKFCANYNLEGNFLFSLDFYT